jgi:large subunit ribosomal protein L21
MVSQTKEKRTKKVVTPPVVASPVHSGPETYTAYAIFQSGGKQYQGVVGKTIALEKQEGKAGDSLTINEVLLKKGADGSVEIGQPFLKNPIKASIVKHMRGPKLIVFKFKRRKKSRVKKGHRQDLTIVRIESI